MARAARTARATAETAATDVITAATKPAKDKAAGRKTEISAGEKETAATQPARRTAKAAENAVPVAEVVVEVPAADTSKRPAAKATKTATTKVVEKPEAKPAAKPMEKTAAKVAAQPSPPQTAAKPPVVKSPLPTPKAVTPPVKPVKTAKAATKTVEKPVRAAPTIVPVVLADGTVRMWKEGTRRGIVYVEGRENAERLLTVVGRRQADATPKPRRGEKGDAELLDGTMAVYSDRKGRPFAWQIPFEIGWWDQVTAAMHGAA